MKKMYTLLFVMLLMSFATMQAQNVDVTFQVDMGVKIATGYFNPATDVVTCPGGFNNWLNEPPANTEKVMTDPNNDSVYTITISMAPSQSYEYKFNIGLGWDGKDETHGNRSVAVGTTNITVPASFFNDYTPYTGVASTINFQVDMRLPARGNFDPANDNVFVAGNFTDWGTGAIEMTDANNDSIFTVDVTTLTSGNHAIYKFIWSTGGATTGTWESPQEGDDIIINSGGNRIYGIHDGVDTVYRFWNNVNPNIQLANGNILFTVDMSVMEEVGIYDNVADSVQLRGSFNGWSAGDPARSLMNQNALNPNEYFLDISFTNSPLGGEHFFKFFANITDTSDIWNDGYERPTQHGGGNRDILFNGQPSQQAPPVYFDGVHPDWVIPTGTSAVITFNVDMAPAMDPNLQPIPFVPATDTLYWIAEQPTFVRTQNWTDVNEMRVLVLTDPNSDGIYSGTLTVTPPSFNTFLYRYAFVRGTDTTWVFEPEGFSNFAYRTRFINQTAPRTFSSPWNAPTDTWTNAEIKTDQEVSPFTSVKGDGIVANDFKIEQNYPNPFNPSTIIKFSIPEQGFVTLKVYSMLGEEIATLVNEELQSSTYEVNFNASNLSSGVYFYTISSGDFNVTKKMMLIK